MLPTKLQFIWLRDIKSKGSKGESCKTFRTIPKSQACTKRLCFGRSIQKFLNSSLPKSGPLRDGLSDQVMAIAHVAFGKVS
jgi:hypothetical protein